MATVKNENVIEIIDSNDEDDDIQTEKPHGSQNENRSTDDNDANINNDSIVRSESSLLNTHNVHAEFNLVEVSIPLGTCDSNGRNRPTNDLVETVDSNDQDDFIQSENPDGLERNDKTNSKSRTNSSTTDEDNRLVQFESNQKSYQFKTKYDSSKRLSSSTTSTSNQSKHSGGKRFNCKHCDYSTKFKCALKKHQRIHANGKLIGIKAHSNGLYHCTLCIRKFTDIGHLSKHMKLHKDNRYVYECSCCMRKRFERKVDKDKHESRCKGRHFECHLCKLYATAYKVDMQCHMRTHSSAKPFRCMVCEKFFQKESSVRHHLNSIHNRKNV